MPNPSVAQLIADRLPAGLQHPGNPDANQPPFTVPLPGFRTTGMPTEHADAVNGTAKLLGEAIVETIESAGNTIIPSTDLEQLKAADQQPGEAVPVLCQDCGQMMFALKLRNGRYSFSYRLLTKIPQCPHGAN